MVKKVKRVKRRLDQLYTEDTIGLSDIRNWLIHGELLPKECQKVLWILLYNLKWILERVVIKILGWPVEDTEIDLRYLKDYANALKMMPEAQMLISQALKTKTFDGVNGGDQSLNSEVNNCWNKLPLE